MGLKFEVDDCEPWVFGIGYDSGAHWNTKINKATGLVILYLFKWAVFIYRD